MKSKRIIINLDNNIIKVNVYNNIKILIIAITKEVLISIIVYNSKRKIISIYFNIVVLRTRFKKIFKLLNNRDLLFKLKTLNKLLIYIYIIDYKILKIFVRNNSNKFITLSRR